MRITLVHASEFSGQGIGRFRISATAAEAPEKTAQLPAKLRPVAAIQPEKRTPEQAAELSKAFREVATSLKADRDELKRLQKDLDSLGIVSTLVMGDRRKFGTLVGQDAHPRELSEPRRERQRRHTCRARIHGRRGCRRTAWDWRNGWSAKTTR